MTQHVLGSDFLGAIEFITGEPHHVAFREPEPKPAVSLDDDKSRIERAREIWRGAVDPRGTIAEDYLVGRRLELSEDIANRVIRFHPSLAWRERDGDPVICVQAMIAAMRNIERDEIVAVSCRRLTPDGHKVGKPKFRGVAAGSAIKLDADETVTHGLHIGEGVESCMSARQLGLKPTWALGSTSNIAAFPVLSGIECLTILGENDDASPEGGPGLRRALACGGANCPDQSGGLREGFERLFAGPRMNEAAFTTERFIPSAAPLNLKSNGTEKRAVVFKSASVFCAEYVPLVLHGRTDHSILGIVLSDGADGRGQNRIHGHHRTGGRHGTRRHSRT